MKSAMTVIALVSAVLAAPQAACAQGVGGVFAEAAFGNAVGETPVVIDGYMGIANSNTTPGQQATTTSPT